MKDRKRLALYLSSLAVLCAGFVIIRYALLSVHGMREWPLFLFIGGLSLLFISFLQAQGSCLCSLRSLT